MRAKKHKTRSLALLAAAVLCGPGAGALRAGVIDLREAVCREPSLIHHYTFEVPQEDANTLRLADRAGESNLTENIRGAYSVTYGEGYDPLSRGGSPAYVTNNPNAGAAWTTTNAIALPSTMTVECVVRMNEIPNPESAILTSRQTATTRGYHLWVLGDGKLILRIGNAPYITILAGVQTGHWYYAANTYTVSGGNTTINSYIANLTTNGPLVHAITNVAVAGDYGTSAVLGIGVLSNPGIGYQYFAPCTVDDVALYNTAHTSAAISNRWEALRLATPTVEYRELFPNDTNTAVRAFPCEGWKTHRGTNAVEAVSPNMPYVEEYNTAFDTNLVAVASLPQDTGVTQGYLNNHAGLTDTNYLYWTEEMTDRLDVGWLKLLTYDARFNESNKLHFALRVDTNATPANVGDDAWFCASDFDRPAGASTLAIPTSANTWHRHRFEVGCGEWAALDFVSGSRLVRGVTETALPTNGLVTAFGLLADLHTQPKNDRIDNVTLYARRAYPPPPLQGTLIRVR
jgi:hypothetical protein